MSNDPVYAKIGAGVVLIDPTGISVKADINTTNSVDAALAWGDGGEYVFFHTDYLWVKYNYIKVDEEFIHPYFGIGMRIMNHDYERWERHDKKNSTMIGMRIPGGVLYSFKAVPIEVFAEGAFIMNLVPETSGDLDIAVGARFLF